MAHRDPKPENDNIDEAAARLLARSVSGSDEETVALFAQHAAKLLREIKERLRMIASHAIREKLDNSPTRGKR